ncbi:MAG: peptide chain release factor N(5)-glutamine methyltransferase [bacterium]|nr:peptide chain release factor N(5)-glutamine methyltransferase [bacterium]
MIPTGHRVVSARTLVTDVELPDHEATRLLESASGRNRTSWIRDDTISAEVAERFSDLASRRQAGEPLQYIEGSSQFGPIEVAVDPRVLIPRPETEQLWELTISKLAARPPRVVVDLGTGSGVLAIAVKHQFPEAEVHAVDVSMAALEVARRNVTETGAAIELHRGDLFEPLPPTLRGRVDLVISNPPYIATGEHLNLPSEVRDHEPPVALFGGDDGLDVLRRLIAQAPEWLAPGGLLACEIGADQGDAVVEMAAELDASIVKDLSGRDRFLFAQKGPQ